MNLARLLKKNAVFLVVLLLIIILFLTLFVKKESFYNSSPPNLKCNFDYCSGDFEVVNGECTNKCSVIRAGYVAAKSNPMICKESETSSKTFSRNFNKYKKKNKENNYGCECPTNYTKESGTDKCVANVKVWKRDPNQCKVVWGYYDSRNGDCYECPRIGNSNYYPVYTRANLNNKEKCYSHKAKIWDK